MHQRRFIASITLSLLMYTAVSIGAQPRYSVIDLGIQSSPHQDGLSNDGIAAGSLRLPNGSSAPALSDHGDVTSLPIFGHANARNNRGTTIGNTDNPQGGWPSSVPFEWTANGYILWPVPADTLSGWANAINDTGIGVCVFSIRTGPDRTAWCNAGGFTLLPDLGREIAQAWTINAQGYAGGSDMTPNGETHLVVWTPQGQLVD